MRIFGVVVCFIVSAIAGAPCAFAQTSIHSLNPEADLVPAALQVYTSSEALTSDVFNDMTSIVSTGRPEKLDLSSAFAYQKSGEDESGGGKSYLPVLFSAIIPGSGEIYLGYKWRGAALVALEVAAWTGYFHYRNEGLDTREAYERFADVNWNMDKWMTDHYSLYPSERLYTPAQMDSMGREQPQHEWPGYLPWVSKEEDKQHFYENIGKYDWYISGWRDYDPEDYVSGDLPDEINTDLRDQYRAMRKESNDQLETADKFIYVSLGVRVFSIIETLFLVRASDEGGNASASADEGGNQLRFHAKAKGWDGGEFYIQYSFK